MPTCVLLHIRCLLTSVKLWCSADGLTSSPSEDKGQENLLSLAKGYQKLVVFSGSGLSAGSGEGPVTPLSRLHVDIN